MVPKQEKRKWLPVKLLHSTMDQDAWEVQWYNTHDQGDMLAARYYLAWEKPNGEEIYCANAVGLTTPEYGLKLKRAPCLLFLL